MKQPDRDQFDVLIIGGGIAGSLAAWTFSQDGLSVALIDEREMAAPFFRAERISSLAVAEMRRLGLSSIVDQFALPLESTAVIKGSTVERVTTEVDYSIPLWQLVNRIRDTFADNEGVTLIAEKVESVENHPYRQSVKLAGSQRILTGKLVVVATGASTAFLKQLGVRREIISRNHSSTFGFDLETGTDFLLPASSITVRICRDGADYMNIFPTSEGGYRANLFTYWPAGDERQREFIKNDPTAMLRRLGPRLMLTTGEFRVKGAIECGSVSVMKSTGYQQAGFVLIGDAYGRICPCAGRGINKVIQDVLTLKGLVPRWVREETALTAEVLQSYYHEEKREAFEEWVFEESLTLRDRIMENSPKQLLRRVWYHHLPPKLHDFYWNHFKAKRSANAVFGNREESKPSHV
jgi:2-polyprenyl-6-methoxyphenol hydroxylase-like FAD-dependent oxidoreductase